MSLYQNRYRKALKYSRLLASFAPFIRMIALTGSMAVDDGKAVTEKSDIDFFIQAEKGRIWTVRFFSTALIWILGQKRHDRGLTKKIAGRFCLNWYGTNNLPKKRGCQYKILYYEVSRRIIVPAKFLEWIIYGKFGDWLESFLKKHQIKRIELDPRTHQLKSEVRYNDEEIGLHPAKP